ncbi:hypothetical protein SK128_012944, partial [Halocaridina rubra]
IVIENEPKAVVNSEAKFNRHAYHCLGESVYADVFSSMNFLDTSFRIPKSTFRASKGDTLEIEILNSHQNDRERTIRHFPAPERNLNATPFVIQNAQVEDSGLYFIKIKGVDRKETYFDVIIRGE